MPERDAAALPVALRTMDIDGWVRHRAMVVAASEAVPPAELLRPLPPPQAAVAGVHSSNSAVAGAAPAALPAPLPGLSRLAAKVRATR